MSGVLNLVDPSMYKNTKHPKCAGFFFDNPGEPREYDCGYDTSLICDDCKYNNQPYGRKDPEAKCNQL